MSLSPGPNASHSCRTTRIGASPFRPPSLLAPAPVQPWHAPRFPLRRCSRGPAAVRRPRGHAESHVGPSWRGPVLPRPSRTLTLHLSVESRPVSGAGSPGLVEGTAAAGLRRRMASGPGGGHPSGRRHDRVAKPRKPRLPRHGTASPSWRSSRAATERTAEHAGVSPAGRLRWERRPAYQWQSMRCREMPFGLWRGLSESPTQVFGRGMATRRPFRAPHPTLDVGLIGDRM